ncbi:MAG: hypothetical protein LQ344_006668 [Seirophora lacunosa]|nr:MAG: hypothetical protein LQ344_006668 [Seirophora lacunosa]
MKELGLDFGWGPTAFLQWSLEHVVVHLETPWWASLAITTLAIRLFLFGLHIGASDNAARLEAVKPHLTDIRKRLDEAKETRNMRDMLQYNAEMRQVFRLDFDLDLDSNIPILTALVPEVAKDSPDATSYVACISASYGDNDYPDNRSCTSSRARSSSSRITRQSIIEIQELHRREPGKPFGRTHEGTDSGSKEVRGEKDEGD